MATFPGTSSVVLELDEMRYDLRQLDRTVKAILKERKEKEKETESEVSNRAIEAPSTSQPSTSSPEKASTTESQDLFHLHTFTIDLELQCRLLLQGWAGNEPNPAYEAYQKLLELLQKNVDPLVPLTLMPPTKGMIHIDKETGFRYRPSASFLLHTPHGPKTKSLLYLPDIPSQAAKEWMPNSSAKDLQHWLAAILALDPEEPPTRKIGKNSSYRDDKKRFYTTTGLQVVWVPAIEDTDTSELKLLVTIDVKADLEALRIPLPEIGQDILGLILHSLLPPSGDARMDAHVDRKTSALQHFFECLRPAPDHPITFNVNNLQPKQMISTLYPFQTRTLALLLQREGASGIWDPDKSVLRERNQPYGLWSTYDLGSGKVAFRRTTGDMVFLKSGGMIVDRKGKGKEESLVDGLTDSERAQLPPSLDLSSVKGTMLCEEMGLGKTVEALGLLILHRHPLSRPRPGFDSSDTVDVKAEASGSRTFRNSSQVPVIDLLKGPIGIKHDADLMRWAEGEKEAFKDTVAWDDAAQLHVTEVATTLIVTPPSLLKQWVSEMHKHAPGLRVCVYEGWKSLQAGINKQRNSSLAAYHKNLEKRKRKEAESFRKKTQRKYARLNDGTKVKTEEPFEDLPEEVEEEDIMQESSLEICQRQFVDYVRAHDVVVTTYGDLSSDLNVALPAPRRSRRANVDYGIGERPRSPLIMVEWWRVIMDEVQLHGDQSQAADMVSLIPRRHSLAMSGTPARSDIRDLMGSLKFLRVPVITNDFRLWHRLQQPPMRPAFDGLFRALSVRTTKQEVACEFHLPLQTRMVVPIELSEIELHYYNDTLDRQRDLLHLPTDPSQPRPQDWWLDRALFRTCLLNLRQICTHIQVGQMQAGFGQRDQRGQRVQLGRQLMTMTEALEKMRDDHAAEYLVESRQQMRSMIKKAQLMMLNEEDDLRFVNSRLLYEKVRERIEKQIQPVQAHLEKLLSDRRANREGSADTDDGQPQSQRQRERQNAITQARQSIREMWIIEHQSWFFEGDLHHIQKEEDREVMCYEKAEAVRKELLARPLELSNRSVNMLQNSLKRSQALEQVNDLKAHKTNHKGGIRSNSVVAQANELLKILNGNAELVFNWRRKIISLLSLPVEAEAEVHLPGQSTNVENPDEEFYAEALKAQGDVEAFLAAYATALADRKEFILEERSLLASHEGRVAKLRKTQAAKNAKEDVEAEPVNDVDEQMAMLMRERQTFRDAREVKDCKRPLKGLLIDLNSIALESDHSAESMIAKNVASEVKVYIKEQSEHLDNLLKELDVFRKTFNQRVIYFAALQEISDSVSVPEFRDLKDAIKDVTKQMNDLEAKLARMTVKGRFLTYLGSKENDNDELKEHCIICMGSSDDSQGVLLECGHFFCQSCFREYRRQAAGRKCPSCRAEIDTSQITKIKLAGAEQPAAERAIVDSLTVTEPEDAARTEQVDKQAPVEALAEAERQRRADDLDQLRMMDIGKMREIVHMDILGEYGSKINFLLKHLQWYRSHDRDARHVIFSNWSDSLNIVVQALAANGFSFVSFDANSKKNDVVERFKNDTSITVFLLHAERESSGLTLTSCRVVHLLEPVLRHSYELQAIGRVDRLGQDKETTVYCYATMDTVESRILSQGVRNGTSIYLKDEKADKRVANMPNVVSAAHKGGDLSNNGNEEELLKLIM